MKSILFILVSCLQAMAYDWPVGVPPAWIEPDLARPARPDPWTEEVAGYYYLSWSTGVDSGRTYGHPGAPRKTIPNPVPAGSYVEINGTYTGSGDPITVTVAGDAGSWVANTSGPAWVCGLDSNNRASFGNRVLIKGSYGYFDQVDTLASTGKRFQISSTTTGNFADHILLRNFEVDGDAVETTGNSINGHADNVTNDIIMYAGEVYNFGPNDPDVTDLDNMAIFISDNTENVWILNNTLSDCSGAAVAVSANSGDTPLVSNVYIGKNTVSNVWAAGLACKTSANVVFSENTIYDVNYTSWSQAKGIGGQYSCQSVYILFNTIYNCDYGIRIGSTNLTPDEYVTVIGNVIYNIQEEPGGSYGGGANGSAAIALWGSDFRYVVNNTIYDAKGGIYMPGGGDQSVIENNIISGITDYEIYVDSNFAATTVKNNDIYRSGGGEIIRFSNTQRSVSAYNTAFSGSANISSDPLFTNAAEADFTLQVASGAIGTALAAASLTVNSYDTYQTAFSQSILFDRAGTARPQNTTWDIGAYEYTIGGGGGGGGTFNATTLNITNLTVGP